GVASDGTRILVSDSSNRRVLIWESWPTVSGEPADLALGPANLISGGPGSCAHAGMDNVRVATDGTRIAVGSANGLVKLWDTWPAASGTLPDHILGQPNWNGCGINRNAATIGDTSIG